MSINHVNYKNSNTSRALLVPRWAPVIGKVICNKGDAVFPNKPITNFTLRHSQLQVLKEVDTLKRTYGVVDCILCRETAFGKTITSIAMISHFRKKTLVLVNKKILVDQWVSSIEKFSNIKCCKIYGKHVTVPEDAQVIVGTLQTFSKKNIDNCSSENIGILIIDECHTLPTEIFVNVLFKYNAKIRIGLSATPEREDKKEAILFQHLPFLLKDPNETRTKKQTSTVYFVDTKVSLNATEYTSDITNKVVYPQYINLLAENIERNNILLDVLYKHLKNGRKILFLSDRLSQLHYFLKHINRYKTCLISGKSKGEYTEDTDIILATSSIAGTGFDVPFLDTLFFGTPKKNLKQLVGRIYRKKHDTNPIIIDPYSSCISYSKNSMYKRRTFYKSHITNCELEFIQGIEE
jgi:superfamily II DNA or RNA helicase